MYIKQERKSGRTQWSMLLICFLLLLPLLDQQDLASQVQGVQSEPYSVPNHMRIT